MESLSNWFKKAANYVKSELQPALQNKPMYQLLLKWGVLLVGLGLVLLADFRHLIGALIGFALIGIGAALFNDDDDDDATPNVRTLNSKRVIPVDKAFGKDEDIWNKN